MSEVFCNRLIRTFLSRFFFFYFLTFTHSLVPFLSHPLTHSLLSVSQVPKNDITYTRADRPSLHAEVAALVSTLPAAQQWRQQQLVFEQMNADVRKGKDIWLRATSLAQNRAYVMTNQSLSSTASTATASAVEAQQNVPILVDCRLVRITDSCIGDAPVTFGPCKPSATSNHPQLPHQLQSASFSDSATSAVCIADLWRQAGYKYSEGEARSIRQVLVQFGSRSSLGSAAGSSQGGLGRAAVYYSYPADKVSRETACLYCLL